MVLIAKPIVNGQTLAIIVEIKKEKRSGVNTGGDILKLREVAGRGAEVGAQLRLERRDKRMGIAPWVTDFENWTKYPEKSRPNRMSNSEGGIMTCAQFAWNPQVETDMARSARRIWKTCRGYYRPPKPHGTT